MTSYYQYSTIYNTPTGSVRRSSTSHTSYSSGGPGSGYQNNYSSSSYSSSYSSSKNNRVNDIKSNGLISEFSGSGSDIFKAITDSDNAKGFKKQDYNKLKEQCRQSGKLFEDPLFLADDRSLFYSQRSPRKFVWKRPGVSIKKRFVKILLFIRSQ